MITSNQYMGQVRRALTCPPTRHEKFMQDLKPLLENFSVENPDASLSDFEEAFGAPEELAQQYMSTLDQEELSKYRRRRKWLDRLPLVIMGLVISGLLLILYVHSQRVLEAEFTSETTMIVTEDMSIEEMKDLLKEVGLSN